MSEMAVSDERADNIKDDAASELHGGVILRKLQAVARSRHSGA